VDNVIPPVHNYLLRKEQISAYFFSENFQIMLPTWSGDKKITARQHNCTHRRRQRNLKIF